MTERKVSILTPVFNRPEFLIMMVRNINIQDYDKKKLEWVLLDDGHIPLSTNELFYKLEEMVKPVKVKYVRETKKRELGDKRNQLVKLATNKIVIHMDDDDMYLPSYISYSINSLINTTNKIVGSSCMNIFYPYHNNKCVIIKTNKKKMIHEATMCYTKKFFRSTHKFKGTHAEGQYFLFDTSDDIIGDLDIKKIMVCTSHKTNTYDKNQFKDNATEIIVKNKYILESMKLINNILGTTNDSL